MAREYRTGVKITGDASGGVRATKAARSELDKLSKAQKHHNSVADRARQTVKAGGRAIGAFTLAAGAAVGIVGGLAKQIADKGDRIQKLSIQLGTSTEFISGMSYAADIAGSNLESFATGFGKMQKTVSDGVAGLSTAVRGFDQLGLKAEELKRLKPEDQFRTIAERLGAMEDKSQRVATAMDIFGRSGRELIPLFEQGSAGIDKMFETADRFGALMSKDLADASAQFNDELRTMKLFGEGVRNQFGEGLIPELIAVQQHFLDGAESSDIWKRAGEFLGTTVRRLVATFIGLKTTLSVAWETGKFVFDSFVILIAAAVDPIVQSASVIGEAIGRALRGDFFGAGQLVSDLPQRVVASWTAAMADIKTEGEALGASLKTRVETAVDDVNDVLTRTPAIARAAGSGMATAGDGAEVLGKNAQDAAKGLQSLLDRLDPLAAMARQYAADQAKLNAAIANTKGDAFELEAALILLRAEYARNKAEAEGYGDAAVAAGQKAIDAAIKTGEKAREELAKTGKEYETFQTAFERGVERMDDLFADLWRGIFEGSRDALDTIKDFFKNWLAEMAHAAFTRPIQVQFQSASQGFGQGGGNFFSQFGSLFGMGGGGSSFGSDGGVGFGGGNLGGGQGAMSNFFGGGSGAGFAGIPVIGWILAGMALGDKLYSRGWNAEGLDSKGELGAYAVGSFPTLHLDKLLKGIGLPDRWAEILSGIPGVTALWGHKKPKVESQGLIGSLGFGGIDAEQFFNIKAKGGLFRSDKRWTDTVPLDEDLAAFFDDIFTSISGYASELAESVGINLAEALAGFNQPFELMLDLDPEIAQQQLQDFATDMGKDLIGAISDVFGEGVREFVSGTQDIDAQLTRLAVAAETIGAIADNPLLDGRTFADFLAVAESMSPFSEDLAVTMARLVQSVGIVTQQIQFLEQFVDQDLGDTFDKIIEQQGRSLQDIAAGLVDHITDLRINFTGSAEDLQALTIAASNFTQVGLEFLNLVEQARAGISAGTAQFAERIQHDMLGDEAFYNQITDRAEKLALAIRDMTDPAQIAATQAEILRLTQTAYGLLSPEQRASQGQGFLDFIHGVEADALEQLTEARENFLDDSEFVRGLIDEMVDGFADPLTIVANAHETAADDHMQAASDLSAAAGDITAAARGLGALPGIIGAGLQQMVLHAEAPGADGSGSITVAPVGAAPPPSAPPPVTSPPGGGGQLTSLPGGGLEQIANVVGGAIQTYGQQTVQAMLASDRRINIDLRGFTLQRPSRQTR